jgi:hypothetical protein
MEALKPNPGRNRYLNLGLLGLMSALSGCASVPAARELATPEPVSPYSTVIQAAPKPALATDPATHSATHSANVNAAGGAVAGAAAGCVLAKLVGEKCADGAALGAVIGAAIGWSTWSEKVADGKTVNAQAKRDGLPPPENEIRLKSYQVSPSGSVVEAGSGTVQVVGDITLYGQSARAPEVMQSMLLYQANGEPASDTPQIARVEKIDGAGRYRAVGVYKIPRGMQSGLYSVQSTLTLNGKVVARRDARFRVVGGG